MSYPYVQARNHGGTQTAVNRIVIHATVSPTKVGGAKDIAGYFHTTANEASAHYVVDPKAIYQCLTEKTVGWHAPPNTGSIGIELCDPQSGSSSRWHDANHEAMLRLAAKLVREVAHRWGVPLTKLTAAQLKAGKRGICGHADVSAAFHQTDHTDPGSGFPWAHFMQLVTEEDDMPYTKDQLKEIFREVLEEDANPAPSETVDKFDPDGNPGFKPANKTWAYRSMWRQAVQGLVAVWRQNKKTQAQLTAIEAKVDALAVKPES